MTHAPFSPYERMEEMYRSYPQAESLLFYVEWHLKHGFPVFNRPDFFVMGRPIIKTYDPDELARITEQLKIYPAHECDCWYVHAIAGNMARAWIAMPWKLPWMVFERIHCGKRELRFCRTETLLRLTSG